MEAAAAEPVGPKLASGQVEEELVELVAEAAAEAVAFSVARLLRVMAATEEPKALEKRSAAATSSIPITLKTLRTPLYLRGEHHRCIFWSTMNIR